jgi:hypothetical protein
MWKFPDENEKYHALVNRDGRDVRDAADAVAWNYEHPAADVKGLFVHPCMSKWE